MPYKEKEINKLYFSIGEVSKILDLSPSLIRFWEKFFNLLPPKKNRKGNRLFTQEEIDHLQTIRYLVKEKGYTLNGAKEILKQNISPESPNKSLLRTLIEIRTFLVEIRDTL